ncbi:MAG: hypothetical protein WCK41_05570 [Actinomycetes bacterium]|jgi:chromosome segregation ATPase
MSRALLERRLNELTGRLRTLRGELAVVDEQLAQLVDDAGEARIRSLVSETPLADQEHREAARQAEAMTRHRATLTAKLEQLERGQDELLDQLIATKS